MKKLFFILFLSPLISFGQNFHFSTRLGLAGYNGDLKAKPITVSQSKPMLSIGARYDLTEHIAARSYLTYGALKADDKKGTTVMQMRNLSFETKLLDFELGAQYNILNLNDHWWTPYVFAGVGFFHFNPYTMDASNTKVYLKPLATEGQGVVANRPAYKLTQFSIPFGLGGDYLLDEDKKIGLEFGYRLTNTDYIDDVSTTYADPAILVASHGQSSADLAWRGDEYNNAPYPATGTERGSAKYKDGYYYVALTFTFRFYFDKYKETSGMPGSKRDKRVGCPATRY